MLGSRVSAIAYPLLVLALTGSPVMAGWASFAVVAPSMVVYLPGGALVDRWDPRRAMLFSEVGRGLAISVIVALTLRHWAVPWLIGVAAIEQILEVFSVLAERRCTRSLVEPNQAAPALARAEARNQIVVMVGRPLGGLLFGISHILPFFADACTFAFTVRVLIRIGTGRSYHPPERAARRRLGHEIVAGFGWLLRYPFARTALLLTAGTTLIGQALIMIFFAEAHTRDLPAASIGFVLAASGAGGALGAAVASRLWDHIKYKGLLIQIVIWAIVLTLLAWSGGRSFLLMASAMAALGLAGAMGNIAFDTFVLHHAAETMLGRVMSVDRLSSFAALAIGPPLGGILFERFGMQASIICLSGAMWLLVAVATSLPSALRRSHAEADQVAPVPDWSERTTRERGRMVTRSPARGDVMVPGVEPVADAAS
jgi:MFS family permease